MKAEPFENALQNGRIRKHRLCVFVWAENNLEKEIFENAFKPKEFENVGISFFCGRIQKRQVFENGDVTSIIGVFSNVSGAV